MVQVVALEPFHTSKECRLIQGWVEPVGQEKIYVRSLLNSLQRERPRVETQAQTYLTLKQLKPVQALLLQRFGVRRIRSIIRKRNHRKTRDPHLLIQIPMTLIQTLTMIMMMKTVLKSFSPPLGVS